MSVIGLDIGTTGCKAIVFDNDGRILGQAAREYPILTLHPRWAEQDAEQVFRLACAALCEAVSKAPVKPDALALSVQGEAVIPVDGEGTPLRPSGWESGSVAIHSLAEPVCLSIPSIPSQNSCG